MALKNLAAKLGVVATRFLADLRGVSTVEYALIVVAIIGIIGAGAAVLGGAFGDLFEDLSDQMTNINNVMSAASSAVS